MEGLALLWVGTVVPTSWPKPLAQLRHAHVVFEQQQVMARHPFKLCVVRLQRNSTNSK